MFSLELTKKEREVVADDEMLVKLAKILNALFDDKLSMQFWLRLPNLSFEGKSPMDLLLEGRGKEVLDLLYPLIDGNTVA